jgi:hypothetical protein
MSPDGRVPRTRSRVTESCARPNPDEADDGSRTRDLQLGKLTLYQLSYVRTGGGFYDRSDATGRALQLES